MSIVRSAFHRKKQMQIKRTVDFTEVETFLHNNLSSPTHWPDWNLIVSKHFSTTFFYFAAYEDNLLIGICPVHKAKYKSRNWIFSGQTKYIPYGGWIFSKPIKLSSIKYNLSLNEGFCGYSLPNLPEFNASYSGVKIAQYHKTLVIDLQNDYEDIFKNSYVHRVRKNIRKAIKNNVSLKTSNNIDLLYPVFEKCC